jgi:hypothetical protein
MGAIFWVAGGLFLLFAPETLPRPAAARAAAD